MDSLESSADLLVNDCEKIMGCRCHGGPFFCATRSNSPFLPSKKKRFFGSVGGPWCCRGQVIASLPLPVSSSGERKQKLAIQSAVALGCSNPCIDNFQGKRDEYVYLLHQQLFD
jgi:hypothetical protein